MITHYARLTLAAALVFSSFASGQESQAAPAAPDLTPEDVSYTLGVLFARQMIYGEEYVDFDVMTNAMKAVFAGGELDKSDGEMQSILNAFSGVMQQKRSDAFSSEGAAFLESKRGEDGVQVTGSGLLYKEVAAGTGNMPSATDTVRVHYRGTFTNGDEFDSSIGKDPVEFQLNQVIPGWTEGLQLMKEGGKAELYIPYSLAYGESGMPRGGIPPFATLIFEIELLEIVDSAQ